MNPKEDVIYPRYHLIGPISKEKYPIKGWKFPKLRFEQNKSPNLKKKDSFSYLTLKTTV